MAKGRHISRSLSGSDKMESLFDTAIGRFPEDRYHALALAGCALGIFTLLIPHHDNYGRFWGDPGQIRKQVLSFARYTNPEIAEALDLLEEAGLIVRWEWEGRVRLVIVGAEKHQKLYSPGKPEHPHPLDTQDVFVKSEDILQNSRDFCKNEGTFTKFSKTEAIFPPNRIEEELEKKRIRKEGDTPDPHSSDQDIIIPPILDQEGAITPEIKITKAKKTPSGDSRIRSLIDYYFEKHKGTKGFAPVINGGQDGAVIKKLLSLLDRESPEGAEKILQSLIDRFLADDDDFLQKTGYTLGMFGKRFNALRLPGGGKTRKKSRLDLREPNTLAEFQAIETNEEGEVINF